MRSAETTSTDAAKPETSMMYPTTWLPPMRPTLPPMERSAIAVLVICCPHHPPEVR